ncbi:NAD(P)/FAD-dependent oxidoreductase [Pseudooceanicola sp. MF1-13]|uniref:NAD(P)/FAD-dependent oxidoreductase n=1 Tax=Pseudooceanicola sp. MF1-13 TaxID=3379095 RepID=UPI003892645F
MKFAVIGAGLIGSAAARHLATQGAEVTLIGPDEPADKTTHTGPFASHYDEGRITRGLDPSPFWSRVSRASIARYAQIEAASGIRFYSPVGCMMAGTSDSRQAADMEQIAARDGIPCTRLDRAQLAHRFSFFDFPDDTIGLLETKDAGHISPRRLVSAQIKLAKANGAQHIAEAVMDYNDTDQGVSVRTATQTLKFDRILLATGGFSNPFLGDQLSLTIYGRTVVLFEVSEAEAKRLSTMPSLIYLEPPENHPYLLPPIRYPDGRYYLKMGGPTEDPVLSTKAELTEWFQSPGDTKAGTEIEAMLRARMPDLQIDAVSTMSCVTSYTPNELPYLRSLSPRVFTATGGCGRAAKNSDELGRLGAGLLTDTPLPVWAKDAG